MSLAELERLAGGRPRRPAAFGGKSTGCTGISDGGAVSDGDCPNGSLDRAGPDGSQLPDEDDRSCRRWATEQVGRKGRAASAEVADELGCDWHTVNDTVFAYGEVLVDEPGRFGQVDALGLDEVLFVRRGPLPHQTSRPRSSTCERGQLLDLVPGRGGAEAQAMADGAGPELARRRRLGHLGPLGPLPAVFDAMVPGATQVADPFHVSSWPTPSSTRARRRVQNETLGHRGRKEDPLYRARRLLTMAEERLEDQGRREAEGPASAPAIPRGDVAAAWQAKEAVRELYAPPDEATRPRVGRRPRSPT